jgi:hypothetical protein
VAACTAAEAGCNAVAVAGESSGDQEFVNGLATRLATASSMAYTAVYAMGGGDTGTVAHRPTTGETAYTYPTGMTLVTVSGATVCTAGGSPTRSATCGRRPTVAAASTDLAKGGLIRSEVVIASLTASALDRDSVISEHDSTIAGTSATCVTVVRGPADTDEYDACVTADGLLGSFSGDVNGVTVDITMVNFTKAVSTKAFVLPTGAPHVG